MSARKMADFKKYFLGQEVEDVLPENKLVTPSPSWENTNPLTFQVETPGVAQFPEEIEEDRERLVHPFVN